MAGNGKGKKPLVQLKRSNPTGKQGSKWIFLDVPSDIVIVVSGRSFPLHKVPLVSRSGLIQQILADAKNSDILKLQLPDLPGGAETFELVAMFCYGFNFEITTSNVASLRCATEYLQMTEDYAKENLVSHTEVYLNEVVTQRLEKSVEVLHSCENLLPFAEELKIVSRCVDAIASKACREKMAFSFSELDLNSSGRLQRNCEQNHSGDRWVEDISVLQIDLYQKVISGMICRGICHESIGASIMHYAHCYLEGPSKKQIGLHASNLSKLAKLIDRYLAEIAPDANLKLSKFMSIIELMPDYARMVDDGLYRAIDIYLKAHPTLTDMERNKLCKLLDCQKLSREACAHAAQNERLPLHFAVQVLYFEQLRIGNLLAGSRVDGEPAGAQRISIGTPSKTSASDSYALLRCEYRDLKHEIARMRMRLSDLEKEQVCMKQGMVKSNTFKTLLSSLFVKFGKINCFNITSKGEDKS